MEQEDSKTVSIQTEPVSEMTCSGCKALVDVSGIPSFSQVACPTCNATLTVPAKLGAFRLIRLIGTGGMGAIYHGLDDSLGREVAIKVMLKSLGSDPESLETFKREARMAAALNHPNIVHIYSFGEQGGQPYIVMELVPGKSLDDIITAPELAHPGRIVQIGLDVARGLAAAYDIGLIHDDVKPKNILLDSKGTAKVVDFGLASFVDKHASAQGIWGTPFYISPEKVRRQPVDARSDIYSLGATLYHALAGIPPFDGKTPVDVVKARLTKDPRPLRQVREEILPSTEHVVMRMLDFQPTKRYPNYASLIADLEATMEDIKKTSGPLGFETGIRVVTKSSSKVSPPTTGHHLRYTPAAEPTANPVRLVVAALAAGAIITIGAIAIYIAVARKAELRRISDNARQYTAQIQTSGAQSERARSALIKVQDFRKKLAPTNMRAQSFCGTAMQLVEDAGKKADELDEVRSNAQATEISIGQASSPQLARKRLDALKSLQERATQLEQDIVSDLNSATDLLKKARDAS